MMISFIIYFILFGNKEFIEIKKVNRDIRGSGSEDQVLRLSGNSIIDYLLLTIDYCSVASAAKESVFTP